MATLSLKFLNAFYYSLLSGGLLMQIPKVDQFINPDYINNPLYIIMVSITFILWAFSYFNNIKDKQRKNDLDNYERRKKIDKEYGNED